MLSERSKKATLCVPCKQSRVAQNDSVFANMIREESCKDAETVCAQKMECTYYDLSYAFLLLKE